MEGNLDIRSVASMMIIGLLRPLMVFTRRLRIFAVLVLLLHKVIGRCVVQKEIRPPCSMAIGDIRVGINILLYQS